jgi:hypothetical protein
LAPRAAGTGLSAVQTAGQPAQPVADAKGFALAGLRALPLTATPARNHPTINEERDHIDHIARMPELTGVQGHRRIAAKWTQRSRGGSMGKRLTVLGAAIALVALAVGVVPAWGSSSDKDKQTTFRVDAVTTEQNFEGTSLGDQIVFTSQLLKGDTEVGHQGGVCTVTSVERGEAQCIATYSLRGGQITGQALISLGNPAPYAVAVTGGSGKYKGVEGEIRVQPVSETRGS